MKNEYKTMSMDQLDNVAGGTYVQSMEIARFLEKAGYKDMFKGQFHVNLTNLRSAIDSLGLEINDHGGLTKDNTYKIKGCDNTFNHDQFKMLLNFRFPEVKFN